MDEVKKSGDHVIGRSQNELDPKILNKTHLVWPNLLI
jgi:hypothetical protein